MSSNASDARQRVIVLGDVMTDVVVRLSAAIAIGSDTLAGISIHGGGSGANQATWLAASAPQLEVHFVGAVGDDLFGGAHRAAFLRTGVAAQLRLVPDRPTGTVVSLVDVFGERSMLTERGANAGLSLGDLPRNRFQPGAWLHISGYTLLADDTRPVALEAIRLARSSGMRISVDPASAALLLAAGRDAFLAWTTGTDLCFPNLDEGRLLAGATDPAAVARALCAQYGTVALKLGARGAILADHGAIVAIQECERTAVVDSTGAGDAFCAGFLGVWTSVRAPHEALSAGMALASQAVAQVGARPALGDVQLPPARRP